MAAMLSHSQAANTEADDDALLVNFGEIFETQARIDAQKTSDNSAAKLSKVASLMDDEETRDEAEKVFCTTNDADFRQEMIDEEEEEEGDDDDDALLQNESKEAADDLANVAADFMRDIVEGEGLNYLAGYAAYRFKNKHPSLGTPTKQLPATSKQEFDWIQCISDGHLTYPSNEMIHATRIVEQEFNKFHGKCLSKESKIFDKVSFTTF